jgi:hypothetical protein
VTRNDEAGFEEMWLVHQFAPKEVMLITIAGDSTGTRVYLDGLLVETFERFHMAASDCSGAFVLGTGVTSDSTWSGDLFGMAFYSYSLTAADVSRHYELWSATELNEEHLAMAPAALYRFDERVGDVVHNSVTGEAEIEIPSAFSVPIRTLLEGPSMAHILKNGPNWPDIVINVGGFVPFGFFLFPLMVSRRRGVSPLLLTIVGAVSVSFMIEITQSWLPTRSSSLSDVLTNGLGATLGVVLYLRLFRLPRASSSLPESTAVRS